MGIVLNSIAYSGTAENCPEGMVWIPGGEFQMGSSIPMFRDARPLHRVAVDGFWMDVTEVTNAQFARFVTATHYVTLAERRPLPEAYPDIPAQRLVAGSIVFSPPPGDVALDNAYQWWRYVPGANWRHPEGPDSTIKTRMDHPVVHIAWEDATAYARWANKRLPTEAEWEYAARGSLESKEFVWGSDFRPEGRYMANTFQGHFPGTNTAGDGYAATSPVKTFPANGFGLYGVAGNVWEWTADWYRPDTYARRGMRGELVRNPRGPTTGFDPAEPGIAKRVQKGGSFLCTDQYCARYRPGGRGKAAPDSSANHIGFRLVNDEKCIQNQPNIQ